MRRRWCRKMGSYPPETRNRPGIQRVSGRHPPSEESSAPWRRSVPFNSHAPKLPSPENDVLSPSSLQNGHPILILCPPISTSTMDQLNPAQSDGIGPRKKSLRNILFQYAICCIDGSYRNGRSTSSNLTYRGFDRPSNLVPAKRLCGCNSLVDVGACSWVTWLSDLNHNEEVGICILDGDLFACSAGVEFRSAVVRVDKDGRFLLGRYEESCGRWKERTWSWRSCGCCWGELGKYCSIETMGRLGENFETTDEEGDGESQRIGDFRTKSLWLKLPSRQRGRYTSN